MFLVASHRFGNLRRKISRKPFSQIEHRHPSSPLIEISNGAATWL
jgi:hypothetical protein